MTICYCVDCRWLLRAQWYQGELLQTFADDLHGVLLVPMRGGVFRVEIDDTTVWNRKTDKGLPDIGELKRRVRDVVAPGRDLGHLDRARPDGEPPDDVQTDPERPDGDESHQGSAR